MRLVSLELTNIRSYVKEKILFPQGHVLLAGDIGCGKSTLLIAIEFALFGLRRGELIGATLLRHGTNEGKVVLAFDLDEKSIVIERSLRRTSTSITQEAGSITINDVRTEMSTVELKAKILELLNYPESLLSKSKSLVFRYTIYTPQEQMKQILIEKPDERLDTFRKLFAIDKYKLIRENAALTARELRSQVDRLRGQGDDISLLEAEAKKCIEEISLLSRKEGELLEAHKKHEQARDEARTNLEKLELLAKEREALVRKHDVVREKIAHTKHERDRLAKEINALSAEMKQPELEESTLAQRKKELNDALNKCGEEERELRSKIDENNKNKARVELLLEQTRKTQQDISQLDTCPTCQQEVGASHKESIAHECENKANKILGREKLIEQVQQKLQDKLVVVQEHQNKIREETQDLMRISMQIQAYAKHVAQLQEREQLAQENKKILADLTLQLKILDEQLARSTKPEGVREARERARIADEAYQHSRLALARLSEQKNALHKQHEERTALIAKKKEAMSKAKKISLQHEWLTKNFVNLMFTIEKHVLMALYHQFNDAFKQWFDTLIEDDTINVRLDHDFSPLIEQNGYETAIDNLSGGEKTSVALAYRLALNKVINHALQNLNTDGLLILDEPTDGFSTEQLDRVQKVLMKLDLPQVLVVSHEPKMEGYVDHIIRVIKEEHESKITS